ncbi:glycoside hydrolase/deacetylase [Russula earlei]|uniref:Glycoside hydrolase/deacetylase n=1 Tax=Russula earlei TaxID=71964 RepID=A0ACC0UJP9_9AGAM|nr:glycoside hydrolase/deacetylase [Russula earlei]
MKLTAFHLLPLVSFAFANPNHLHQQRQAASSIPPSSSTSPQPSSSAPTSSSAASGVASSSVSSSTVASENPTAVPLASIVVNVPSAPTQIMPTPVPVGSKPSNIPNAPGVPDISTLSPVNFPALDRPAPTDSPQVQQWIQEVSQSGVTIPNIAPNAPGGCVANPTAAVNSSNCWWTCGGCTRNTDVTNCNQKYQWGLTYDDGPAPYTPDLLSYLSQVDLHATLFVVGSRVISWPALVQEEYLSGHQIAVHTWSHYPLTTLTNEQIIAELGWSKKVIHDVLGVTPTMMRPPFGDIDDRVRAICTAMNLVPVIWTRVNSTTTFDTGDFDIHNGLTNVQQVLFNWENIVSNAATMNDGFIVLEHDLFQQSVDVATGYILPDALARQPALNITPVISCLNRPFSDAYIETNDNTSNPLPLASYGGNQAKNGAIVGAAARMDAIVIAAVAIIGAMALTL